MATWPSELPPLPERDSFTETLPDIQLRTRMDAGPDQVRRRLSNNVKPMAVTIRMSKAQTEIFEQFWLDYCAIRFDWTNPRTETVHEFRFRNPPPTMKNVGADEWAVTFALEQMP